MLTWNKTAIFVLEMILAIFGAFLSFEYLKGWLQTALAAFLVLYIIAKMAFIIRGGLEH